MPTFKFFTFTSDKVSESLALLLAPALEKAGIWYQIKRQGKDYKGFKIGISSDEKSVVTAIMSQCTRILSEKNKHLKKDINTPQPVKLADKQELATLFPQQ